MKSVKRFLNLGVWSDLLMIFLSGFLEFIKKLGSGKFNFFFVQVRIDHRTQSVHFGTDLTESQRTDLPEGPHVQPMPSEQVPFFFYFGTDQTAIKKILSLN
jgi:hypothetical protein